MLGNSDSSSIKILGVSRGGGGGNKIFRGNVKNALEVHKIGHFHAEIVKFGLILTHLQLFGEEKLGERRYFGGKCPMPPCAGCD